MKLMLVWRPVMKQNTVLWFKGLAAAVIGAAAGSVSLIIVDAATFSEWSVLWKVIVVNAALAAGAYLKKSPLP